MRELLSEDLGFLGPLHPRVPERMPKPSDEGGSGLTLYKGGFAPGEDLSNLTLPRMFISRARLEALSFVNSNLSESWMCWNDFSAVDFSYADLSGCDLRASEFVDARFADANLSDADLRQSYFENCDFANAEMKGTLLTVEQGRSLDLSEKQRRVIAWADSGGKEPDGG